MKKFKLPLSWLLAAVMLASCLCAAPLSSAAGVYRETPQGNSVNAASASQAAEDELIVTFKKSVSDSKIENTVEAEDAEVETIEKIGSLKLAQVSTEDMQQTAQALAENTCVEAVQPNYQYHFIGAKDPLIDESDTALNQYQFKATNAFAAWDLLESGSHGTTVVTAIDTGMDIHHEDLMENQVPAVKKAGNYTQYAYGEKNVIDDDTDDSDGHGTHVNGIIGATYNNGLGGSGIASGHNNDLVRLLPVSASADGYSLFTIDIIKAIDYAVENGAKVVNMSFGGDNRDLLMDNAIKSAYYNKGVVFVAASGNDDTDDYTTPSDLKEVISVNAADSTGEPTYFSNFGIEKDITAPGQDVMSTLPGDDYNILSGTSMASPVVAAVAALVLDANPNLTPAQVYNILCASAKQPARITTRFNIDTGYGNVDAEAAVRAAKAAKATTAVEDIQLKNYEVVLSVGGEYGAEILIQPATALAVPQWSIEDTSIATVDAKTGIIRGLKAGTTTLTVTAGGKTITQSVRVKKTVELSDIRVKNMPHNNVMATGEIAVPNLVPVPYNATFRDIYVKSDNTEVITTSDGVLIAKHPGTATITVQSWNGKISKQYKITVKNGATQVSFTKQPKWVMMGATTRFTAEAYDKNGFGGVVAKIRYKSGNQKVLKVNAETGVVTPVAVGKTYVTATEEYSGDFEAAQIQVVKNAYGGADYGIKQTAKTKDSITLSWNKIPVAQKYLIERKDSANGAWRKVTTVGSGTTTYRQSKLLAGKVYYYRVTAQSTVYKGKLKPSAAPAMRTVPDYKLKQSAKTKTTITLKWNKAYDATGYYIQYRVSKTAKWKTLKFVNAKTLSFRHMKLKAGRIVYYRIIGTYKVGTSVRMFDPSAAISARTSQ
ncbi:MAG: S8 family serine peptidase [Clostridia bacterium]|nr:S8 family serine peptidase [Clostridia bacterium]